MVNPVAQRPAPEVEPIPRELLIERLVHRVALQTLSELTASIALGATCSLFVPTTAGIVAIGGVVAAQAIFNLALRGLEAKAEYDAQINPEEFSFSPPPLAKPSLFALGTACNPLLLLHEAGHYAAAEHLFQHANPTIRIVPFIRGNTHYDNSELSDSGEKIGFEKADFLVSLAGPVFSISASTLLLIGGLTFRKRFPEIGNFLIASSLFNSFGEVIYALSALGTDRKAEEHDYVVLWNHRFHPMASVAVIGAIPASLFALKKCCFGRNNPPP